MKHKKAYRVMLCTLGLIEVCYISNRLYDTGEYYYKLYKNPYREQEVELSKDDDVLTRLNKVEQFFDNLSQTEVMQLAMKIDPQIISGLENICEQNPYIDLNLVAERISTIDVSFKKLKKNLNGVTYPQKGFLFTGTYIDLTKNNPAVSQTYFHELLHAIMPIIKDCSFLEEGIASLWCQRYYGKFNSSYKTQQKVIMKLESVLGKEPFFEMKATGSIEPIKRKLKSLGYDETFINQFFLHMEQYQECYSKLCDTELDEEIKKLRVMEVELENVLFNDIDRIYQDVLGRSVYDSFDVMNDVIVDDNGELSKKK